MPDAERKHWSGVLDSSHAGRDGMTFLALALDSVGVPIPVVNTDPATLLYLGDFRNIAKWGSSASDEVRDLIRPFVTPYPVGLYVPEIGPLVANDAYAGTGVWEGFRRDEYHGPRVVWGREVNLFLLGVTGLLLDPPDTRLAPIVPVLKEALEAVRGAVRASGLKESELWTYAVKGGNLVPARYPASCDIQLWNLTDLAVDFQYDRLQR